MNGQFGIGIILSGKSRLAPFVRRVSSQLTTVRKSAQQTDDAMSRMRRRLGISTAIAAGTALAARGMFHAAKAAGDYNQQMDAARVIMGLNVKEFRELEKAAFRAGLETQFTPLQAAKAMVALGQAGLKGRQAIDALRPSLDLAAASLGKLSTGRAVSTVIATMKTFGLSASDSKRIVDSLIHSTNQFNISIQQLPGGVGNVARGAIALNQSLDDTLIALGLVKNVLPSVTRAATLTSSAMLRLSQKRTLKALDELGVSVKNAQGDFLPFVEIVRRLDIALRKKYTDPVKRASVATDLLGKQGLVSFSIIAKQLQKGIEVSAKYVAGVSGLQRSQRDASKVILKGSQAIEFLQLKALAARGEVSKLERLGAPRGLIELAKQFKKTGGAAKTFIDIIMSGFSGQLTKFKSALQGMKVAIGKGFADAFRPAITKGFQIVERTAKAINNMSPQTRKSIAQMVILATAVLGIVSAFYAMRYAVAVIGGAAFMAFIKPILIISAVLAALLLTVWDFRKGWSGNMKNVSKAWRDFSGTFMDIMKEMWPSIKRNFREAGEMFDTFVDMYGFSNGEDKKIGSGWKNVGIVIGGTAAVIVWSLSTLYKVIVFVSGALAGFIHLISKIPLIEGMLGFFKWTWGIGAFKDSKSSPSPYAAPGAKSFGGNDFMNKMFSDKAPGKTPMPVPPSAPGAGTSHKLLENQEKYNRKMFDLIDKWMKGGINVHIDGKRLLEIQKYLAEGNKKRALLNNKAQEY